MLAVLALLLSRYTSITFLDASLYTDEYQATEGTTYASEEFSSQYVGATKNKFIRGAYHFAQPSSSSGASQARFFLANGGGWSKDGITLPGMLDIEYAPTGDTCYGLSASAMVAWVSDFVNTYQKATGRYPMIYSTSMYSLNKRFSGLLMH